MTNAPTQYTATGDKLIPVPGDPGSYWIDERLMITIERDVAGPEAPIVEMGQLSGGVVVERYYDVR